MKSLTYLPNHTYTKTINLTHEVVTYFLITALLVFTPFSTCVKEPRTRRAMAPEITAQLFVNLEFLTRNLLNSDDPYKLTDMPLPIPPA